MQLPELPKMYRRKYKNSTEIQEAGCRKRKNTVKKYNKKILVFSKN